MSGTFLTSVVMENKPIRLTVKEQTVTTNGFLADYVTFHFETPNRDEACYLAAVLNAPHTNMLIKPMQARGLWGPRHICKKVLELPIPQFQQGNPDHRRLAELAKQCAQKVERWLGEGGQGNVKSIGRLRGMVREMLKEELKEIDKIVKKMLR